VAKLAIEGLELAVRMSVVERAAAIHGDVRFPLASVTAVAVEPNVWAAMRGIRAPGTGIPFVIAYGTLRHPGGRDFVLVRGGRRPGLRIDFGSDAPFARLLMTVADPQEHASAIRQAVGHPLDT